VLRKFWKREEQFDCAGLLTANENSPIIFFFASPPAHQLLARRQPTQRTLGTVRVPKLIAMA